MPELNSTINLRRDIHTIISDYQELSQALNFSDFTNADLAEMQSKIELVKRARNNGFHEWSGIVHLNRNESQTDVIRRYDELSFNSPANVWFYNRITGSGRAHKLANVIFVDKIIINGPRSPISIGSVFSELEPYEYPEQVTRARRGADGSGFLVNRQGKPGKNGKNGPTGGAGALYKSYSIGQRMPHYHTIKTPALWLFVNTIEETEPVEIGGSYFVFEQNGANGGNGQQGFHGGHGGDGGKGKKGVDAFPDGCAQGPGRGGNGGNGGNGGRGGTGGSGSDGGDVFIVTKSETKKYFSSSVYNSKGGSPGKPGLGGRSGKYGEGGHPGDLSTFCRHGDTRGADGEWGRKGLRGQNGQYGKEGRVGIHVVDDIFNLL